MLENSKVILGSGYWVNRRDWRADGSGRADMGLGQASGLAGGWVGPAGRDMWDWVNQYWADLTKNVFS